MTEYSTLERWQGIGETGVVYERDSLYAHFEHITDPRKAQGKRYALVTLLVIIFLAKLCGQNIPVEIADWAKNHAEELAKLLKLQRTWMPHHNTIRRVFYHIVDEAEFDRMAREYSQQDRSTEGDVWAMDGKTLCGTRIAGEERAEHVLSVYDGQQQSVKAQVLWRARRTKSWLLSRPWIR
jgi:hypothetical protein